MEADKFGPVGCLFVRGRRVEAMVEEDGLACYAVVEDGCILLQLDFLESFDACAQVWRSGGDVRVEVS